ncbi:MAG: PEP-CTERM sorting domain-containing protein [Terriglobales bacterium]
MKTTLFVLSIALVLSVSTPLLWGDTIYDVGGYSVGINTISGMAQVLGSKGGYSGPILTFTTGVLQSGTLMNGTFAAGGAFDLNDYNCGGCRYNPKNLFAGSFAGPTSISTNPQGLETLSGVIGGTVITGRFVTGNTTQYLSGGAMTGSSYLAYKGGLTAPEPSTLPLLVTGLIAIAGPARRRFTRQN